ncbi:hypothetical protein DRO69_04350 [Candidatus Bathyarchaeota archaeon]|nr:MAG: hypothetical protein DRO69_04350 [Candidatus Bathyarchaeota archaeon]
MSARILLIFTLYAALCLPCSQDIVEGPLISSSRIIEVPIDYPTVQAAIDAAGPEDTIIVKKGIYYERLVIDKSVSLFGEDKMLTVIDGNGTGSVVTINANNVSLSGFTIKNSGSDTYLSDSSGILILGSGCIICDNYLAQNDVGIYIFAACNNTLCGNYVMNSSFYGILVDYSFEVNIISDNVIMGSELDFGIGLDSSSCQVIRNNTIIGCLYNGIFVYSFTGQKPMENLLIGNIVANSSIGINLVNASYNIIKRNSVENSVIYGLKLFRAENNVVYYNNFVNNMVSAYSYKSNNAWDGGYPLGGNYWSDHESNDEFHGLNQDKLGGDGLGDASYYIDTNNVDHYPLMAPIKTFNAGTWDGLSYNVDVVSPSVVSNFQFDPDSDLPSITFDVSGEIGTNRFCRVHIPKNLLGVENGWVIYADDEQLDYLALSDDSCTYLYFTHHIGLKTVRIIGTYAISEFSSAILMLLFTVLAVLVTIFRIRF